MYNLKPMKRIILVFFAVFIFFVSNGCRHSFHTDDVLQKVILHYGSDKEKVAAVRYLTQALSHHTMITVDMEKKLDLGISYADSCYYAVARGKSLEDLQSPGFREELQDLKKNIDSALLEFRNLKPRVTIGLASELITANRIIAHVDHAFFIRAHTKAVKELDFEKFCQYFIPFENTPGYPIRKTNQYIYTFFSKYLPEIDKKNVSEVVKIYHTTISNFRLILGAYPFEEKLGFEELLFNEVKGWECFDVTSFGAFSLNSCGLPTGVAYYIAYESFSLEGSNYYPKEKEEHYKTDDEYLNIYRISYENTRNSPFNISINKLDIPENLRDPLISDITGQFHRTAKLNIKFPTEHNDKIVYLCSFSSRNELIPVTWGKVQGSKEHLFENVVPNRLYFPCLYDAIKGLSPIGNPFMVEMIGGIVTKKEFSGSNKKLDVDLLRKYPLKKQTRERIESLIGTVIVASDQYNFENGTVDTLYVLKHKLTPYLQDLDLNNEKPYQFYKILAPSERPNLYLSETYFMSRKSNGYQNVIPAPELPDLPSNGIKDDFVWVLDGPLEDMRKKAEYDGNVGTAPSAYPSVSLNLEGAQIIDRVRVCPLNEDNGIDIGDIYSLYGWAENKGWTQIETKEATVNYLSFKAMSSNRLYWLKNDTKGKEEMLFFIDEKGDQRFVYDD
jgi:hypothetical protein